MTGLLRCVLVANRGEIARRVIRSAAARGMRTVAVYSDADAGAPFVREADRAVRLPGIAPADTYLRGDLVVAAALRAGADCVHPGYGFLSESAGFARDVIAAGLVWVGPPPVAMAAMAAKLSAKALMAAAGVPTAPSIDATGLTGEALAAAADRIGYPLLVKASLGGGGRGMREVGARDEVAAAVAAAGREALSAFGDGTVFLERLIRPARHVEVQIFGDTAGTVVALHERDCSLQRRHQKVVEESPSPAVDARLRRALSEAAVRAGRAIGYTGAGTVEFLLAPDGSFSFLEVNTRLQVEHPVTEAVTGLDLVDLQFAVACGEPLPPEALAPPLRGAAVEVRLYAEDPASGWSPQPGRLDAFSVPHASTFAPAGRGVRLDSGVEAGSEIGVAYDAMLAKVIAWAPDRTLASALLASALRRAEISGITTNRDLLVRVLESPRWLAGDTDTDLLAGLVVEPLVTGPDAAVSALAAALGQAALRQRDARVLAGLPAGWRNNPSAPQTVSYLPGPLEVRYARHRDGLSAWVGDDALDVADHAAWPLAADRAEVVLEVDGLRRAYEVHVVTARTPRAAGVVTSVHVHGPAGSLSLSQMPRFPEPATQLTPGSLTAPMPGSVVRLLVAQGDRVDAGQQLMVLEAMKMEHIVAAPTAGTVQSLPVSLGATVSTGSLLAVVRP